MRRWLRIVPVVLMGSLAVAYVVARPTLRARIPYLDIFEFPVGAIVVALLLWAALARRPPAPIAAPWRKHAQVVRELPDPALASDVATLERWVETGRDPERAADVVARARAHDEEERESLRRALAAEFQLKASRRKRGSTLEHQLRPGA